MNVASSSLFTGITKRRWTGIILIWVTVGIFFSVIYRTAHRAVINEIRSQVTGVAIATAAGIDAADLERIVGPDDMTTEAFARVQGLLDRISSTTPDVRYIYTMRRDRSADARASDFLYIVDQSARDDNGNHVIDADEISESPGNTYDAREFPAMVSGWNAPAADKEITPDPPYPDLISGYAPVKNTRGITEAIVGVDVIAPTVRRKLFGVRVVILLGGVVLSFLVTLVVQLYYQQHEALDRNRILTEELASRNDMLRGANTELAKHNRRFEEDLKLAENVQRRFLPNSFPRRDRLTIDKFHLTCDILGGDLFDVFSDQEDHVALYMADVAGHGISVALISGLLKMAVSTIRERTAIAHGHLHADLTRPDKVLTTLNEMLVKEIPDHEFITLVYGVLDLSSDILAMSSAGHPPPVHYRLTSGSADFCAVSTGTALGFVDDQSYPVARVQVAEGDRMLFYTNGLVEAMNVDGEDFGGDRVLEVVRAHGTAEPSDIITALRAAVETHCGGGEVSDDFSLLVAQLK